MRLETARLKQRLEVAVKPTKFKVGDGVTFKSDPEASGSVLEVKFDPKNHDEPMYRIKLGVGSEWAGESELRISKRK
jgi:hypothetical protein